MENKVHFIDNMIFMATLPDKHFNLAVVDPQYGINAPKMKIGATQTRRVGEKLAKGRLNSGGGKLKNRILNKSDIDWDDGIPTDEYFEELFRVSENQIIWGGNYFHLPPTRCIICWDKLQPWDNFSQWEMAWTSFDMPAPKFSISSRGGNNMDEKIHPTQKPIALYRKVFEKFAKVGDNILDTHLGSGSSRIAAWDLGIDFVGCENNKKHFDDQEKRFGVHIKSQSLYLPRQIEVLKQKEIF